MNAAYDDAHDAAHDDGRTDEPGPGFWIGFTLGVPVVVYGIVQLVGKTGWPRSWATGRWLVGGLVVHDAVLVPVVLALVWGLGRVTPVWLRTPMQAGVLMTGLVLALGWPGLRGYGDRADNATVHPLDYGSAVLTALVLVWAVVAVWAAARRWSRARASRAPAPNGDGPGSPRTSRTPAPG